MEKSTAEVIVKVYAIIAWLGALVALIGAFALFFGGSLLSLVMPVGISAGITGALAIALGIFFLALAIFYVFVGFGLWNHSSWARIAVIVMSVLDLFSFPIGTIIGAVGIWLFGFDETIKSLFSNSQEYAVASPTTAKRAR